MICRDDVISNAMQRIICTFCRRPFFQGWDRGTTDYTPNSLRGPTYNFEPGEYVSPSKDLVRFFCVHHFCSEFWWVEKALPCEVHSFCDHGFCATSHGTPMVRMKRLQLEELLMKQVHGGSYLLCLWGSGCLHLESGQQVLRANPTDNVCLRFSNIFSPWRKPN